MDERKRDILVSLPAIINNDALLSISLGVILAHISKVEFNVYEPSSPLLIIVLQNIRH
jgi:hypothetical protein